MLIRATRDRKLRRTMTSRIRNDDDECDVAHLHPDFLNTHTFRNYKAHADSSHLLLKLFKFFDSPYSPFQTFSNFLSQQPIIAASFVTIFGSITKVIVCAFNSFVPVFWLYFRPWHKAECIGHGSNWKSMRTFIIFFCSCFPGALTLRLFPDFCFQKKRSASHLIFCRSIPQ